MSLYDGVGIDSSEVAGKDNKDVSGWSSSFKLLQSHSQLQAKKATSSRDKKKSGASLAPVVDLKRSSRSDNGSEMYFNQLTGKLERATMERATMERATMERATASTQLMSLSLGGAASSPFISTEPMPSLTGGAEEYDPLRPNEYEDYVKKRREQRNKEREEERRLEIEERERKRRERHRNQELQEEADREDSEFERRRRRREEEEEEEFEPMRNRVGGAAIAPPTSLIEEDISTTNEAGASSADQNSSFQPPDFNTTATPGASFGLGGSVASKIMAKYGYKEGQGLGKKEQGMSIALQVEKTSKRGGKIIHERDLPKNAVPVVEPPRAETTNANILRNISKVVLLRNMVGPGEVDEELEGEVAEECSKYGKVLKCMIFEMPDTVEEEAVRIFLEFERQEAAIKGVVDLNGRFFGGRAVRAGFYNLDKFRRFDLGDEIE